MSTITVTSPPPAVAIGRGQARPVLTLANLCAGLPVNPLPPARPRDESVPHAPVRTHNLSKEQQQVNVHLIFETEI